MSDQTTRSKRWDQLQREQKARRKKSRKYKKRKFGSQHKRRESIDLRKKFEEALDNLKL